MLDLVDEESEVARLRAAIAEHHQTITEVGNVRVADPQSAQRATAKHAADSKLWDVISEQKRACGACGHPAHGIDPCPEVAVPLGQKDPS